MSKKPALHKCAGNAVRATEAAHSLIANVEIEPNNLTNWDVRKLVAITKQS